jgi:hypothetical protein
MNANDVYNIAKALPEEELLRLYYMLDISVKPKKRLNKKRKTLPKFTVNDGIRYLINNHFNKIKES